MKTYKAVLNQVEYPFSETLGTYGVSNFGAFWILEYLHKLTGWASQIKSKKSFEHNINTQKSFQF